MEEKAEAGLVWVGCGSSSEPSSGSEPRFEESIDPNPKATLLNSETRFQEMKAKSGAIAQLLDVSMFSLCLIGWVRIGGFGFVSHAHLISSTPAQFQQKDYAHLFIYIFDNFVLKNKTYFPFFFFL